MGFGWLLSHFELSLRRQMLLLTFPRNFFFLIVVSYTISFNSFEAGAPPLTSKIVWP